MRCVLGLQENVVTGMADGYYRIAGKPACTLLHCGPGLANGLAQPAQRAARAQRHRQYRRRSGDLSSAVRSTADSPTRRRWRTTVSAWVRTSAAAAEVGRDAAEAVQAARTFPGQIATLMLPSDTSWDEGGVVGQALRGATSSPQSMAMPSTPRPCAADRARRCCCCWPAARCSSGAGPGLAHRAGDRRSADGGLRECPRGARSRSPAARACAVQHRRGGRGACTLRAHHPGQRASRRSASSPTRASLRCNTRRTPRCTCSRAPSRTRWLHCGRWWMRWCSDGGDPRSGARAGGGARRAHARFARADGGGADARARDRLRRERLVRTRLLPVHARGAAARLAATHRWRDRRRASRGDRGGASARSASRGACSACRPMAPRCIRCRRCGRRPASACPCTTIILNNGKYAILVSEYEAVGATPGADRHAHAGPGQPEPRLGAAGQRHGRGGCTRHDDGSVCGPDGAELPQRSALCDRTDGLGRARAESAINSSVAGAHHDHRHCPTSPGTQGNPRPGLSCIPQSSCDGQVAAAIRLYLHRAPHRSQGRRHVQDVVPELREWQPSLLRRGVPSSWCRKADSLHRQVR